MSDLEVVDARGRRAAATVHEWGIDLPAPDWTGVRRRAMRRARATWATSIAAVVLVLAGTVTLVVRHGGGTTVTATADRDRRAALASLAREMIDQNAAGDFHSQRARFTDALATDVPEVTTQGNWAQVVARNGSFAGAEEPIVLLGDAGAFVDVPLRFANGSAVRRYWFDEHDRLTGLVVLSAPPTTPADGVDPMVRERAQAALEAQLRGDYETVAGQFNDEVRAKLPVAELRAQHQSALSTLGDELERSTPRYALHEGATVVTTFVAYRHGVVMYRYAYDSSRRIAGLFLLDPGKIG